MISISEWCLLRSTSGSLSVAKASHKWSQTSVIGLTPGALNGFATSLPDARLFGKSRCDCPSYYGGAVYGVLMRVVDVLLAFPSLVVLGFNLLGDGLRDLLDPRLKR